MPSSWHGWLVRFLVVCCVWVAMSLVSSWWFEREVRPLLLAGQIAWLSTVMGLLLRRKLIKEREPNNTQFRWYQFSLAEMLVLVTGLALFLFFQAADDSQRRSTLRQREQLQTVVSKVLGPEGRLGFEKDGSLLISVCDRSFDDQRFAELESLIRDYVESNGVSIVLFGTGPRTMGTPPRWPGVTDASVDILLQWQDIKMLSIQGANITPEGRKRLLGLEKLDETSQAILNRE